MAFTYSHSFINRSGLVGHADYLVPADKRMVVRQITLYVSTSGSGTRVHVRDATTGATFLFYDFLGSFQEQHIELLHVVLEPGHVLQVDSSSSPLDVTVSGYLLSV